MLSINISHNFSFISIFLHQKLHYTLASYAVCTHCQAYKLGSSRMSKNFVATDFTRVGKVYNCFPTYITSEGTRR